MKSTDFLQGAIDVQAERGQQYDSPEGERSMGRAVTAFNAITGRDLTEAEGWLLLQVLKDVRQWQRPDNYHHDSALDCVSFASLKAEALFAAGHVATAGRRTTVERFAGMRYQPPVSAEQAEMPAAEGWLPNPGHMPVRGTLVVEVEWMVGGVRIIGNAGDFRWADGRIARYRVVREPVEPRGTCTVRCVAVPSDAAKWQAGALYRAELQPAGGWEVWIGKYGLHTFSPDQFAEFFAVVDDE